MAQPWRARAPLRQLPLLDVAAGNVRSQTGTRKCGVYDLPGAPPIACRPQPAVPSRHAVGGDGCAEPRRGGDGSGSSSFSRMFFSPQMMLPWTLWWAGHR